MSCLLNKEDIGIVVAKVAADLSLVKDEFDLNDYIKQIYDHVKLASDSDSTAHGFAQVVPFAITKTLENSKAIRDNFRDKKLIDLNVLADMNARWLDDITNTVVDLGIIDENDADLTEAILHAEQNRLSPDANPDVRDPIGIDFVPFYAPRKATWASTTSNETVTRTPSELLQQGVVKNIAEAYKMANSEGYAYREGNRGIKNPEMAPYFDFIRNTINDFNNNLAFGDDSRNLKTVSVKNGYHLTVMSATRIPTGQIDSNTRRWLSVGDAAAQATKLKDFQKTLVTVVTNENGDPLHFEKTEDGVRESKEKAGSKIIYYTLNRIDYKKSGEVDYAKSGLQTPSEVALVKRRKSRKGSRNEKADLAAAQKRYAEQEKILNIVEKYIRANPAANQVRAFATGGSLGSINSNRGKKAKGRTALSEFSHTAQDYTFTVVADKGASDNGYTYVKTSTIDVPVDIWSRGITISEATLIADFLVDDIYENDKLLNAQDKYDRIYPFIKLTPEDGSIAITSPDPKTLRISVGTKMLNINGRTATEKEKNRAEAKAALLSYFTQPYFSKKSVPIREIEAAGNKQKFAEHLAKSTGVRLWEQTDPNIGEAAEYDIMSVKTEDGDGKPTTKYYRIRKRTFNIDRDSLADNTLLDDFTNYNLTKEGDKTVLSYKDPAKKQITYQDWTIGHTYTYIGMNAEKKMVTLNPYLEFTYLPEDIIKAELNKDTIPRAIKEAKDSVTEKTVEPGVVDQALADRLKAMGIKDKTIRIKSLNVKVTPEQLEAASKWYPSSPLSKHVAFKVAFDLVNSTRPESVASWSVNAGILLNKGSDYTDVYHEAWHAFTQLFLNKEQKTKLYAETRKLAGNFTDFKGNVVAFSTADNEQLEEYLAENFREYMLADGKIKIDAPTRKTIFQYILGILKSLFEGTSVRDAVMNSNSLVHIHDLFEKLRVGNIGEYSFSEANSDYAVLNKGITKINNTDPVDHLSYSESHLISDTIDYIIAEYSKAIGKSPTSVMKNAAAMTIIYKEAVQPRLSSMRNATQDDYNRHVTKLDELEKLTSTPEIKEEIAVIKQSISNIKFNLDSLNYAVNHFGDYSNKKEILADKGVISYHLKKTRFLEKKDKSSLFDQLVEEGDVKRDHHNREGNKNSLEFLASANVIIIMKTLYKERGPNGEGSTRFGLPEFENEKITWNSVAKVLEGIESKDDMYSQMVDNAESNLNPNSHIFAQLVERLGDPMQHAANLNHVKFGVWEEFKQAFDRIRIALTQVTIDKILEESTDIDDNTTSVVKGYTIHTGETSGRHKNIIRQWETNFRSLPTRYIKASDEGNYLDLKSMIEGKEFEGSNGGLRVGMDKEFLKQLGIPLTESPAIDTYFTNTGKRPQLGAIYLYTSLKERYKEGITELKSLRDVYKGEESRLNTLAEIEAKYNPAAGFMATTAEGTTQFEHSQQSSATRIVTAINNSKSWEDLMSRPHMKHLNPYSSKNSSVFNFFTRGSRLLNSIYDFSKPGGPKRENAEGKPVTFKYKNLSGIELTVNNLFHESGVAAADADEPSKMLQDLFTFMQSGVSEGARTSDRGATYLYFASDIAKDPSVKGRSTGNYYIDPAKFVGDTFNETTRGKNEMHHTMMQYLSNELLRVNYMRGLNDTALENFIVTPKGKSYRSLGEKFSIFDDIIPKPLQDQLTALEYSPEESLYTLLETKHPALLEAITERFSAYFNSQTKKFNTKLRSEIGLTKDIVDPLIDALKSNIVKLKYTDKGSAIIKESGTGNMMDAVVEAHIVNSWIHMYEGMAVFYGDMAMYQDPDNFIKRITGATSPGLGFSNDASTRLYYANLNATGNLKPYAKSKFFKNRKYASTNLTAVDWNGMLNTAIFQENSPKSAYFNKYKDILEKASRKRLEAAGNKDAAKIAKAEMKAYLKMDEGDGQGWISFDTYRLLKMSMGEWGTEQESLFHRILSGENVPVQTITQFFSVAKYQYFGPLGTKGSSVTAFHKFSLMPLIPSVIKGTELELMHNRMVEQNIDYALFHSGSKVATLTKDGKADAFVNDQDSALKDVEYQFTKNPIFLEYLKDQMAVPDKYKNKVTFSTQLRKIIEIGYMEFGVPVDFNKENSKDARIKAWKDLRVLNADGTENHEKTDKKWRAASKKYRKLSDYRGYVKELTELNKHALLRDAGLELTADGKYKGNMKGILEMVQNELDSQDLSEHEIEFIEFDENTGKIRNDLSFSPTSDKIEKILVAHVNKRLINQKVNGEGLVLVSNAGFQKLKEDKFTKATDAERSKYRDSDLSFYDTILDKDGNPTGRTRAMKVKVAISGSFERLLTHPDVLALSREKGLNRLDALNQLIKDEKWLDKADHRRMITMVGVRIPVQGLNSTEFMEVYEFLPKEAGSILIPPPDMVAKSGSDFDIDKLMVMMPNIIGKPEGGRGMADYTETDIKAMWDRVVKTGIKISEFRESDGTYLPVIDPIIDNMVRAIFGKGYKEEYTPEELDQLLKDERIKPYEQFRTKFMVQTVENKLINSMVDLLADPDNFANLIRPNGTYLLHDIADDLADSVRDYDPNRRVNGGKVKDADGKDVPSPTRAFEILYNLYKHQAHSVGKQTLGIGAVENSMNILFNGVGAYLSPEYQATVGDKSYAKPQTLYVKHNTMNIGGKEAISLSHIYDSNNEYMISDIISQLINGWVDVAKDTWIFDIQGNKETSPTLLLALAAGVPLKTAVYLVSNPLVRSYIKEQKIAKSEFGDVLGRSPVKWQFFRNQARGRILTQPQYGFNWASEQSIKKFGEGQVRDYNTLEIREKVTPELAKLAAAKNLEQDALYKRAKSKDGNITDVDRAALLQFLDLEDMARTTTDVKMKLNVDTKKTTTTFSALSKQMLIDDLQNNGKFPAEVVSRMLNESPIGSFNIQKFIADIWSPIFAVRNDPHFMDFVMDTMRDPETRNNIENTFGEGQGEKFAQQLINDFPAFIYQNAIRKFDFNKETSYKGYPLDKNLPLEQAKILPMGAFVKDKKMYVNALKIQEDYASIRKGVLPVEYEKYNLAPVKKGMFESMDEYQYFVVERAYLLSVWNLSNMEGRSDYTDYLKKNTADKVADPEKASFQQVIRDMAMDNTFNSWKVFKSENNAAYELQRIKQNHKSLIKKYPVLEALIVSRSESKDSIPGAKNVNELKNIRLQNANLTGNELNMFHDNLSELSNTDRAKIVDINENQRLSEFFKRLPYIAIIQSGLDSNTVYSLGRMVPFNDLALVVKKAANAAVRTLNNPAERTRELGIFYQKFLTNNSKANYRNKVRFKDYLVTSGDISTYNSKIKKGAPVQKAFVTTRPDGIRVFDQSLIVTDADAIRLASENPDYVFVYDGLINTPVWKKDGSVPSATDPKMSQIRLGVRDIQNSIAAPLRLKPVSSNNKTHHVTDATFDLNKERIDLFIKNLDRAVNEEMKTPVFPEGGLGQALIGADDLTGNNLGVAGGGRSAFGTETFNYLSEKLRKFEYVNKNYEKTTQGQSILMKEAPVTNEDIEDQLLLKCYIK